MNVSILISRVDGFPLALDSSCEFHRVRNGRVWDDFFARAMRHSAARQVPARDGKGRLLARFR